MQDPRFISAAWWVECVSYPTHPSRSGKKKSNAIANTGVLSAICMVCGVNGVCEALSVYGIGMVILMGTLSHVVKAELTKTNLT
jgi:hypothetical protein